MPVSNFLAEQRAIVHVLLANWNGARYLDETIRSIVQQSLRDWVMLIADTGSTDGSREILNRWAGSDEWVRLKLIPERLNCPAALNIGLAQTRGETAYKLFFSRTWGLLFWTPFLLSWAAATGSCRGPVVGCVGSRTGSPCCKSLSFPDVPGICPPNYVDTVLSLPPYASVAFCYTILNWEIVWLWRHLPKTEAAK